MAESVVGRSVLRSDLLEKVTGAAVYTVDITPSGTLHAKVVRSSYAHAEITGIDAAAALAMPGVVAVITAEDLKDLFPRFGHIVPDHYILATEKVRYYGEPVALVVAESVEQAADAAAQVEVGYAELPAVMSVAEALAPSAPLVHREVYGMSGDESFTAMAATPTADEVAERDNVAHEVTLGWGDIDAAFQSAALIVTDSGMRFPMLYAYAMEPYNAVATFGGGRLDVISTAQHPFMVRGDLARIFGLPLSRVRVQAPYLGGGYGSKSYTKVEPLAAVASWATGRTVKLVLDVEEAIYTTRADAAEVSVRTGFDSDGRIVARDIDLVLDSGAYADNSPLVVAKAANRSFGPYRVPNLRVRGRSVYTNTSPASSYRGFGAPQGSFACEINLDRAAEQLGVDPAELRRRNLVDPGEEILPGKRGIDADLKADLDLVVESLRRDASSAQGSGIGFAVTASDAGAFPVSTAQVRIQVDGSVLVLSGSTEMGQGSRSVLAQIAAEELGVELAAVSVSQSDTGTVPYERTTGASRTTTLAGLALQRACAHARDQAATMAAEAFGWDAAAVVQVPGGVQGPDGRTVAFGDVVMHWFGANAGEITGIGIVRRDGVTQKMPPFWEVGMVGVEVAVDAETGVVDVRQLVTVADVGFALNPHAVEGQDLGAATQGLGGALYEELVYDGPQLLNPNLVDYRVPRMRDMPAKIDTMIVERRDGIGPYGAKGAGEGALNPMAAAVASAVARATGRWPTRVPLTPERVWRLLNDLPDDA
ncbi:MAG TPA: xanthine dehydrogenase family protein molybdopterin-binding subunit [Jatrophihabitans sp.]|nr:xanthine dehydrogenase family protein molybdopterin-binding subunit [Jatrophihabitans sp.]